VTTASPGSLMSGPRDRTASVAAVPEELPVGRVLAERVHAQALANPRAGTAIGAVRRVGSLQAQDPRALRLAVRARSDGLDEASVRGAFDPRGGLVTTWLMRGTLHAVPVEDVRWLLDLLRRPRTAGRTRRLALGVTDDLLDRALPLLDEVLRPGPLTRAEVVAALADRGVSIGPGQAPVHMLVAAAREGVVCRGADRGDEPTYVRLADRAAAVQPLDRDEALARLAHRYLRGHGPATSADLAAWSGLPLRDARAGLAAISRLVAERDDGLLELKRRPASAEIPPPRLLGAYDPLLLGWTSREEVVGPHKLLVTNNGLFRPFALLDGRAVARWGYAGGKVTIEQLERVPKKAAAALEDEARAVERYLAPA
jgi:Winged helix DNA-binding domain